MTFPDRSDRISKDRFKSLQQQIADDIVDQIKSGAIKGRLPTEEQLEEAYRVSRVTVRGAIKRLKEAGIVAPSQGRGTFVIGKP